MYYTVRLIIEAILAILLFGSAITLIFLAHRALTRPVPAAPGIGLYTIVAATGHAAGLEQTVATLLAARRRGEVMPRIIIADCGLSSDIRRVADLLANGDNCVTVCSVSELPLLLEENGWTIIKTTNHLKE